MHLVKFPHIYAKPATSPPLSPTTSLTSAYDNSTNLFGLTFSVMLCMLHRGSLKVAPYQSQPQPITLLRRTTHFPLLTPPLTPPPSMKNLYSDLLTYSSPPSLQVTLSSTNSHHSLNYPHGLWKDAICATTQVLCQQIGATMCVAMLTLPTWHSNIQCSTCIWVD